MNQPRRVDIILEREEVLGELLETLLDDAGYDAEAMVQGPGVVEAIKRKSPDILVVDVSPLVPDPYRFLDLLRVDPDASKIPVLALTAARPLAEEVLASYNVRGTLPMPFELDELIEKVSQILGQPPVRARISTARPTGRFARASLVLAEHSREALFRWVRRLREEDPWKSKLDLRVADFLDHVPSVIEVLDAGLLLGDLEEVFRQQPDLLDRLTEHARTRRRQGIPLPAVMREYALLKDEIWRVFERHLPKYIPAADVFVLARAVDLALDRIVELTVHAYLEDTGGHFLPLPQCEVVLSKGRTSPLTCRS